MYCVKLFQRNTWDNVWTPLPLELTLVVSRSPSFGQVDLGLYPSFARLNRIIPVLKQRPACYRSYVTIDCYAYADLWIRGKTQLSVWFRQRDAYLRASSRSRVPHIASPRLVVVRTLSFSHSLLSLSISLGRTMRCDGPKCYAGIQLVNQSGNSPD